MTNTLSLYGLSRVARLYSVIFLAFIVTAMLDHIWIAFLDVANAQGMTATALRVFLTTTARIILPPEETAGVIAYVLNPRVRP